MRSRIRDPNSLPGPIGHVLLIGFILLVMMPTGQLNSNEEYYFQLAHRFISPAAFMQDAAMHMDASVRLLFANILLGGPVALFGYEATQILWRLLNAVLYGVALGSLLGALRVRVSEGLIALALFVLLDQQLFGGEWLLRSVESKTLAYPLCMLGLAASLRRAYLQADVWLVLATWLHVLAGGFWMLFSLLLHRLDRPRGGRLWWRLVRYGVLVAPLVWWLFREQFGLGSELGDERDALHALRNAHHVAPFAEPFRFWREWTPGIALSVGLFAALLYVGVHHGGRIRVMAIALAVLMAYFWLAFTLAWLDQNTHRFAKWFLFRPSSLGLLLSLLVLLGWLREAGPHARGMRVVLLLLVLPAALWAALQPRLLELYGRQEVTQQSAKIREAVAGYSARQDIVLIHPGHDGAEPEVNFTRVLDRPTWISSKFVPARPEDFAGWQQRVARREQVFASHCAKGVPKGVRLLLGRNEDWRGALRRCGDLVLQTDHYWLIQPRRP